jgi:hypothetical protein
LLLLSLAVAAGCGGSRAAPGEDAGLRPCTDDDQCLANETCSLGYCQPSGQRDAAPDVEPAALRVTPAAVVDFGSPVYGSEVERTVTLENVGGQPVVVNQIDLVENDAVKEYVLSKPTTPFELQPGASQVLTVSLTPVDGQLDQGQLIINSTDYSHPTVILQLVTAAKGAVDLEMCVEKTTPTDCEAPPAFPLGMLTYGVPVTRVFHVRATGQGTPVINAQAITLLSTGGQTSPHYQLQLFYRHPNPLDPAQTIEDATALSASDFPKLLSAGDENTAPAEIRGILIFDALVAGPVPTESVSVQTDAGNVTAPVTGQVSGCPPGSVDLDGDPSNGCEYACTYQGATDDPDDAFVDANCDGIDGEIGKAIFVAPPPKGSDSTGTGSMDKPYATIGKGIQVAGQQLKTQVFVAAGTYAENVTLVDGISLYGGYDASTKFWQRAVGNDTAIIGHARGNADEITVVGANLTKTTILDRLMVLSQPAVPGFSSYAVMLTNVAANLVTLSNSEIHSGNGGGGTDGGPGTTGAAGGPGDDGSTAGREYGCAEAVGLCSLLCPFDPGLCPDHEPSQDAWRPRGGGGGTSACGRTGGTGGDAGRSNGAGGNGATGTGGGAAGGGGAKTVSGTAGGAGTGGSAGVSGQKGLAFGAATSGGYSRSSGTGGTNGTHGAGAGGGGGGGGDAPYCADINDCACCASYGGPGGGGGAGGCGGTAGGGGSGGGGSFALFLHAASPTIRKCSIYSGSGGSGGRGGQAGDGGDGGSAGDGKVGDVGDVTGAGANGGAGGRGGKGGHGGGGGGGPSIGVLKANGANPTVDAATQLRIYPGSGGLGGTSPDPAASGLAGVSAAVHTI